jgi:hypothetical protein
MTLAQLAAQGYDIDRRWHGQKDGPSICAYTGCSVLGTPAVAEETEDVCQPDQVQTKDKAPRKPSRRPASERMSLAGLVKYREAMAAYWTQERRDQRSADYQRRHPAAAAGRGNDSKRKWRFEKAQRAALEDAARLAAEQATR